MLYYKKFPPKISKMQVLLCDPMLATGGSALMAMRTLIEAGVKESAMVFITVVVCPEVRKKNLISVGLFHCSASVLCYYTYQYNDTLLY